MKLLDLKTVVRRPPTGSEGENIPIAFEGTPKPKKKVPSVKKGHYGLGGNGSTEKVDSDADGDAGGDGGVG